MTSYNNNQQNLSNQEDLTKQKNNQLTRISQSERKSDQYYEILEKKVRDQAKRLVELQNYRCLIEKRLKQFSPSHPLPVLEEHLEDNQKEYNPDKVLSLLQQISQMKMTIQNKDNEILEYLRKIEEFSKKQITKSENESKRTMSSNKNEVIEYINNTNNFKFKEVEIEKDQILENLRNETLINEEQRNYIEILKQTIETTINKLKLGPAIQYFNNGKYPSNVEFLVDFTLIKQESENYRKELVKSEVYINELNQEIDNLKNLNENLNEKNDKLISSLDTGIEELESAKERIFSLENEREVIAREYDDIKGQFEIKENELRILLVDFKSLEKRNEGHQKKIEEYEKILKEQGFLESKLVEYKKSYEGLVIEKENSINEIKRLNEELQFISEDQKKKKQIIGDLNSKIFEVNTILSEEKKKHLDEKEEFLSKIKKIERNSNELNELLVEKENLIIRLNENIGLIEKEVVNYKKSIESCRGELLELKSKNESRIQELVKENEDYKGKLKDLETTQNIKNQENRKVLDFYEKEISDRQKEINKIYSENSSLNSINQDLKSKINEFIHQSENLKLKVFEKEKIIANMNKKLDSKQNYMNELDKLNKILEELQNETQFYVQENFKLKETINNSQSEIGHLKQIINNKDLSLSDQGKILTSIKASNNQLIYELNDLSNKYSQLMNEFQILNSERPHNRKDLNSIESKKNKFNNFTENDEITDLTRGMSNFILIVKNLMNDFMNNTTINDELYNKLSNYQGFLNKSEINTQDLNAIENFIYIIVKEIEDLLEIQNKVNQSYNEYPQSNKIKFEQRINELIVENDNLRNQVFELKESNLKMVIGNRTTSNFETKRNNDHSSQYQLESNITILNNQIKELGIFIQRISKMFCPEIQKILNSILGSYYDQFKLELEISRYEQKINEGKSDEKEYCKKNLILVKDKLRVIKNNVRAQEVELKIFEEKEKLNKNKIIDMERKYLQLEKEIQYYKSTSFNMKPQNKIKKNIMNNLKELSLNRNEFLIEENLNHDQNINDNKSYENLDSHDMVIPTSKRIEK